MLRATMTFISDGADAVEMKEKKTIQTPEEQQLYRLLSVTLPGNDMRMGIKYSMYYVPYFTISDCSSSERVGRRKFFDCK